MNKIKYTTLALLLVLSGMTFGQKVDQDQIKKLETFMRYVQLAYVDTVDTEKLTEDAIKAVLKDLDPHSVYISKKDLQRMNEPLEGNFEGVGIQFNILHDTITVVSPIAGGPSEKLGIRAGDKIIEIDDKVVAGVGFTNKDVADHLRGKKGTKVTVGIARKGESELLDFEITRDKIPIYSMDAAYLATPKTGYIKLNRFAAQSMTEVGTAIDSLQKLGMENLILDLRGNSGGYLRTAIQLADNFLEAGKLVVYTKGKAFPREDYNSTTLGNFEKGKLVVLIDEGSASASEIVTGAVQDWDRGLVIGRKSFGKGLVQKPFQLTDGSAIRLTISRYYTPSGRSIQRDYSEGKEDYYNEINKRYEHGELMNSDSIEFPDSLKFETLQLKRTVYGGGGIMPDIFIPLDTTETSEYFSALVRKGILYTYDLDYLDEHRAELLAKYPTFEDFDKGFELSDEMLEEIIAYAEEKGVKRNDEQIAHSKNLIKLNFKALMASNLWTSTEFYRVINTNDNAFNKALRVMSDKTFKNLKLDYK
ncbi:S41 family peptidase [bacterium SCSIO 12643]|nr:S41 family peptidase [bacterium SCSIO 12643]